jgi:glutamine phosphoribosylpyrophosphate amidotransferase
MAQGRSLAEAMSDSLGDLDGAYNYLVASTEGLGVVRDRFGFKPLMIATTEEFIAIATEEIALRRAIEGGYRVAEPPSGLATLYPLPTLAVA